MLLGSATKLSDLLLARKKSYRAVLKLGISTDTMDTSGKITKCANGFRLPGFEEVEEAAKSFVGDIWQKPPIYSAIKINGKKLYDYARENKEVEPEPRAVSIYSIKCGQTEVLGEYILDIECSKGTYVRSLCHDIGEMLSCGGAMAGLERTRSGNFDISGSYLPEYLEKHKSNSGVESLCSLLVSCEDILKEVAQKKMVLEEFYSKLAKNGAEIYIHKLKAENPGNFCLGDKVLMYSCENILFALGEIQNYEQGPACKPIIFI
jgi:tRNA pseudouridine55 synthase